MKPATTKTEDAVLTDTDTVVDAVVETAKIKVLNPETDRYEEKVLPKKEAAIVLGSQMKEGWERVGATRLSTDKYDPNMRRCFVNQDRSDPATVRAWELGYRPVNDRHAAREHGHTIGKVAGWEGEVISTGDAILMEVPEPVAQARERIAQEQREIAKQKNLLAARNHMESIIGDATNNDPNSHTLESWNGAQLGYNKSTAALNDEIMRTDANARAAMGARSLQQAQEYQRMQEEGSRSTTFGGFQGKPGFNPLPESPVIRRILEEQLGS